VLDEEHLAAELFYFRDGIKWTDNSILPHSSGSVSLRIISLA
jgi:hypothetical protein